MSEPGHVPERVAVTPAAARVLAALRAQHGELMFHQSGGCCDGSSPMCYPAGEFLTGDADVHLGELVVANVADANDDADENDDANDDDAPRFTVPFWMSKAQYEYWKHTHLTVDVVPGRGAGFSLEAPEGVRFIIRSRILTDAEYGALAAAGVV